MCAIQLLPTLLPGYRCLFQPNLATEFVKALRGPRAEGAAFLTVSCKKGLRELRTPPRGFLRHIPGGCGWKLQISSFPVLSTWSHSHLLCVTDKAGWQGHSFKASAPLLWNSSSPALLLLSCPLLCEVQSLSPQDMSPGKLGLFLALAEFGCVTTS